MPFQTRDQKMAGAIFEQVLEIQGGTNGELKRQYRTMALKLPALVRSAGLVQALTFVDTRGDEGSRHLLNHLADALGKADRNALLRESRELSLPGYMYLTQQVLAALLWHRRFAQSLLGATERAGGEQ